ncbi:Hypothetical protein, putative [Bodo saltans]|uniref:Uncharacterized protein n=1 Tax=Bodo saltans TaxID=75058 RepID=A0A0S4JAP3_BODSA|nr:Hypothetical protein, putative [Bodo saltans]|eukprot:CUG87267.1 Hypothetical protein, putative [Bodo saltans]
MAQPWYVYVVGCATSTNSTIGNASLDNLVAINFYEAPTQVIITDAALLIPGGSAPTNVTMVGLGGCSIAITYVSDTAVPAVGASAAEQAHVYIVTASDLLLLSVTNLATLHLEGNFIGVAGNYSGSIGSLECASLPSSLIACRSVQLNNVFAGTVGTSLIRLALGCPQIHFVSIVLNGTIASCMTSFTSFAGFLIDNSSLTSTVQVPFSHAVVLSNISGVLQLTPFFGVIFPNTLGSLGVNSYPSFNGTILVNRCTINGGIFPAYFTLPAAVSVVMDIMDSKLLNFIANIQPQPPPVQRQKNTMCT